MNKAGEKPIPGEEMKNGQFGARESRIHGRKGEKGLIFDIKKPALKNLKIPSIIKVEIAILFMLLG